MSTKNNTIPVDLAIGLIGQWKETYRWIPAFGVFAAFILAFAAGANNLPAPFSTPVGSGVLTFLKASVMACLIYVPGAAFASHSTVDTLFSDFLQEHQPGEGFLMWSMVVVLVTATMWLMLATYFELPVSTQQSTQGALLGTMLVTEGFSFLPLWNKNANHNFNGGGILWIFLEWTVAPFIACIFAYLLFRVLKVFLLCHENAEKRILIFLPISYGISAGLLCLFLMYQVLSNIIHVYKWSILVAIVVATLMGALLSLVVVVPLARKKFDITNTLNATKKNSKCLKRQCRKSQDQQESENEEDNNEEFEEALRDYLQTRVLETVYEEDEKSWVASPEVLISDTENVRSVSQSTPFKQLLESTPNCLVQARTFQKIDGKSTSASESASEFIREFTKTTFHPVIEYDNQTLVRHALAEKFDEMEDFFGFPQLLASCIFALIQSASEIAAIVSPYGAILHVFANRAKCSGNGEDVAPIHVTWWFRASGGLVASTGFLLCGWRLTRCLGGKLTFISNSRGLVSQLSAVATMIMLTRTNLPVSSTHAFVGSLVGVGIADDPQNVNWKLLVKFVCGWVITILFCSGVAYLTFSVSIHSPAYVVP